MEEKLLEMLATSAGIVNESLLFAKFIGVPVGIKFIFCSKVPVALEGMDRGVGISRSGKTRGVVIPSPVSEIPEIVNGVSQVPLMRKYIWACS
jgi:hypothetical protein